MSALPDGVRRAGMTVLLVFVAANAARSDDPVSSNVRYTGDIVRILERRCLHCHGDDGLADPLTTYRQVREWGRSIREEIVEQRMPPWTAARGFHRLQHDLALTAREMATLLSWLDGGMPRGDDRDLPKPAAAPADHEQPGLRVDLPEQRIPALEEHVVRRVVVETNLDRERLVSHVSLVPGRRSVLRGALLFTEGDDGEQRWIGAWLPWQAFVAAPKPGAFRLPPRARLIVEFHYRGGVRDASDRSSVDFFFAGSDAASRAGVGDVTIGAAPVTLASASSLWAFVPAAGAATKSLELTARHRDGTVDVLFWIPEYRHEWPQVLVLETPVALPRGTVLTLNADPPGSAQVHASTR